MPRREKIPETSAEQRDTYHHGDLKRALTEAALGLVTEKGPKGFTLREVARRAGVSAAAPYRHFPDKAQLLGAVATQGFVQLHEALTAATVEKADLTRQVLDMGRAYVGWAVTHPDYYQVMFGSELDKSDKPELLDRRGARLRRPARRHRSMPTGEPPAGRRPPRDRRTDLVAAARNLDVDHRERLLPCRHPRGPAGAGRAVAEIAAICCRPSKRLSSSSRTRTITRMDRRPRRSRDRGLAMRTKQLVARPPSPAARG